MAKKDPTASVPGVEIRHRQGCKAQNLGPGCVCSANVRTTSPRKEPFNGSDSLADRVEAAQRWRSDAMRMVKAGVALDQRHRVTFGMAVDEWLRFVRDIKRVEASTLKDYERIGPLLKRYFGAGTLVENIKPGDVETFRDEIAAGKMLAMSPRMRREGVSSRTVNRYLVALGGVFRRMKGKWNIDHNPAHGSVVQRLTERDSGLLLFYSPEEIQSLVASYGEQVYADMALVAAMTGLRVGELLALRFNDVDLAGSRILVSRSFCQVSWREKAPKSGKVRSVPLADEVAQVIARRPGDGSDLVFTLPGSGGRVIYGNWNHAHRAAVTKASLSYRSLHKLRHTFGTQTAAAGVPLTTIQAWMGHAHISTTMRYAHYAPKRDEAKLVSAAFAVEQPVSVQAVA